MLLLNPEYIDPDRLPDILKKWDILVAPDPNPITDRVLAVTSSCGKWLSMNILMIDETRVIVDPHHTNMMRAMEKGGWSRSPVHSCTTPHAAAPSTARPSTSVVAALSKATFEVSSTEEVVAGR
jgi:glycine amidinotransferase